MRSCRENLEALKLELIAQRAYTKNQIEEMAGFIGKFSFFAL
jgi:hypothetical protein